MWIKPAKLDYYESAKGKKPFFEWLSAYRKLHHVEAKVVDERIKKIEEQIRMGYPVRCKALPSLEPLMEYKVEPVSLRLYFYYDDDKSTVLLHGGTRRDQHKKRDVKRAKEVLDECLSSKQGELF